MDVINLSSVVLSAQGLEDGLPRNPGLLTQVDLGVT